MHLNVNSSELQNITVIVQILGFFEGKSLTDTVMIRISVSAWPGQSSVIQPNSHLDVAVKVFGGCGSHPSSELK